MCVGISVCMYLFVQCVFYLILKTMLSWRRSTYSMTGKILWTEVCPVDDRNKTQFRRHNPDDIKLGLVEDILGCFVLQ